MCGRFAQPRAAEEYSRLFRAVAVAEIDDERYNVAPTDEVFGVAEHHEERTLDAFRWGLVPHWASGTRDAARRINARAETIESSAAFRWAFRQHRCLIPAEAFYEWERGEGRPRPWAIRRRDGAPMALAGVWSIWRDPRTAARLYSCAILTTEPNGLVARLHHRMPVLIEPDAWDAWLDEGARQEALRGLLVPPPAELLVAYPVSPAVNNVRNEGPELLAPAGS